MSCVVIYSYPPEKGVFLLQQSICPEGRGAQMNLQKMLAVLAIAIGGSSCAANLDEPTTPAEFVSPAAPISPPKSTVAQESATITPPTIELEVVQAELVTPEPPAAVAHEMTAEERKYVVKNGDTLFDIARRFGVKMSRIAEASGLVDLNKIYVGQILWIPGLSEEIMESVELREELLQKQEDLRSLQVFAGDLEDEVSWLKSKFTESEDNLAARDQELEMLAAELEAFRATPPRQLPAKPVVGKGSFFWKRTYLGTVLFFLSLLGMFFFRDRATRHQLKKKAHRESELESQQYELTILRQRETEHKVLMEVCRRYLHFLSLPKWLRHKDDLQVVPIPLRDRMPGVVEVLGAPTGVAVGNLLRHLNKNPESREGLDLELVDDEDDSSTSLFPISEMM